MHSARGNLYQVVFDDIKMIYKLNQFKYMYIMEPRPYIIFKSYIMVTWHKLITYYLLALDLHCGQYKAYKTLHISTLGARSHCLLESGAW
jgi:hypothetical protein